MGIANLHRLKGEERKEALIKLGRAPEEEEVKEEEPKKEKKKYGSIK